MIINLCSLFFKGAFIISDDENANTNENDNLLNKIPNKKQMKENNEQVTTHVQESINTVINCVNEVASIPINENNNELIESPLQIQEEEKSAQLAIHYEEELPQQQQQQVEQTQNSLEFQTNTQINEDDIELVIDLDNDFCEIIDTNTANKDIEANAIDGSNQATIEQNNDEEIVILDLDSNQTIIKNSHKQIFIQSPEKTPATTSSKLIFVNSATNNTDNRQFQVHMVTPQSTRVSNSEITITKLQNKKK